MGKKKTFNDYDWQVLSLLSQGIEPIQVQQQTGCNQSEVYELNRAYPLWTGYMHQYDKPQKRKLRRGR